MKQVSSTEEEDEEGRSVELTVTGRKGKDEVGNHYYVGESQFCFPFSFLSTTAF